MSASKELLDNITIVPVENSTENIKLIFNPNNPTLDEIKTEIWKDLAISDDFKISSIYRVYNKKTEKMLVQTLTQEKRYIVVISANGERHSHRIDRLILTAFNPIENMENFHIIHIDKNISNNKLENLKWSVEAQKNHINYELKDLDGEVWKQMHNFPEYKISNKGRIKNIKNLLMKPTLSETGRYIITMVRNETDVRRYRTVEIDRYLMYTFSPVSNMLDMIIIHKNGDLKDNISENLIYELRNEYRKPIINLNIVTDVVSIPPVITNYDNEEWKSVEGSEDHHVSSYGRVRNKDKFRGLGLTINGYITVKITIDKVRKGFLVHRLVLMNFKPIDNMENLVVNH